MTTSPTNMTTPPPPKETEQVNFSDGSTRTLTQFRCPKYSCSKPEPKEPSQHQQPFASRAWAYLNEDVRPSHFAEMQLVLLTFCIGLQGTFLFSSLPLPSPSLIRFYPSTPGLCLHSFLLFLLPPCHPSPFPPCNVLFPNLFLSSFKPDLSNSC